MAYGEVEVLLLIFLTSALNVDEWLASRSGRLVLGSMPQSVWMVWGGHTAHRYRDLNLSLCLVRHVT